MHFPLNRPQLGAVPSKSRRPEVPDQEHTACCADLPGAAFRVRGARIFRVSMQVETG
jgi:hypothetical protein